jgi:hypothetical protein
VMLIEKIGSLSLTAFCEGNKVTFPFIALKLWHSPRVITDRVVI